MNQTKTKLSLWWTVAFAIILFILTRLSYSWWPLSWPDEALFSSPAASLLATGQFTTPVLIGLIPNMEVATLWNGPLYMVLISGIYFITNESLFFARLLSFLFASGSFYILTRISSQLNVPKKRTILLLTILTLDLTFIRAANTARMDMLTFFWVLVTVWLLIREHNHSFTQDCRVSRWKTLLFKVLDSKSRRLFFLAGVTTGLAAMSHPIAVLLFPVWLFICAPRVLPLLYGFVGAIVGMSPWLIYIGRYPEIFISQFTMQLQRKQNIFDLFGGPTGGVFKVFLSQYGEGKYLMGIALLWLCSLILFVSWSLVSSKNNIYKQGWKNLQLRMFAIFFAILAIVIFSSEGWYALYITPFLLILIMTQKDKKISKGFTISGLHIHSTLIIFFLLLIIFHTRELFFWKKSKAIPLRHKQTILITKKCHSIYLRIRPDPYFELRKAYPHKRILEFVPGKLVLPNNGLHLHKTFDSIDCFFLNDAMDWEPKLKKYLKQNKLFQKTTLSHPPLEQATLWWRKNPKH